MNDMNKKDVSNRQDIEIVIAHFYNSLLKDLIVGFIFTDVAKINLETHLPVIVDFWSDIVLQQKNTSKDITQDKAKKNTPVQRLYRGNALQTHLDIHQKMPLTPGHFTRWLYLFNQSLDAHFIGPNTELMRTRAKLVAQSISAVISDQKKGDMTLTLSDIG